MKKFFLRLFLVVVVLVVLAAAALFIFINPLAKTAVEKGSAYALGVDTKLSDINVGLTSGTLTMNGLNVGNPQGFKSPYLMDMKRFDLATDPGSILSKTIVLHKFELDGLDVNVDQTMKGSNVQAIIDNLKRLGGGGKEEKPAEGGKKFKVDKIVITNVAAHFHLLTDVTGGKGLTIKVPRIELNNVTQDNAGGLAMGELIQRVIPAIFAGILEKGKGLIPADLSGATNGDIAALTKQIGGQAEKLVTQARSELEKAVGGAAGEMLKGAGKVLGGDANTGGIGIPKVNLPGADPNKPAGDVKKAVDKTVGGVLGGLLGGKKKDANK